MEAITKSEFESLAFETKQSLRNGNLTVYDALEAMATLVDSMVTYVNTISETLADNEDERIAAEEARVTAESARVTAEDARVDAEEEREETIATIPSTYQKKLHTLSDTDASGVTRSYIYAVIDDSNYSLCPPRPFVSDSSTGGIEIRYYIGERYTDIAVHSFPVRIDMESVSSGSSISFEVPSGTYLKSILANDIEVISDFTLTEGDVNTYTLDSFGSSGDIVFRLDIF